MATKSNFATLVLVVATAVALLEGTAATVYFVGDSLGWTVPAGGATSSNFVSGQHDVAKVTKDALDTCNTTSPISLLTLSPTNFTLSSAGDHHFMCTFGQHCLGGQKLSVSVSSTSPSSPPASPPTTSPSPSPSMAPSPTPSATTSPPPQSPATSPSPPPSATPPASTTSPPPPPATASSPSPPSETTLTPPPPPSSAPLKAVAATLTIMSIALGVIF
ncbi:cucumber peeling cupredoxin-like [Actinidia eriantha]|uniref:cucumber peeling cupredoxin-like n=1 Tax=Actinidia eriantha TaxID=165200 RepID=UPI002582A65F|nr:cucumber peeling cupredoxin-like [Actinidia eriantha]